MDAASLPRADKPFKGALRADPRGPIGLEPSNSEGKRSDDDRLANMAAFARAALELLVEQLEP